MLRWRPQLTPSCLAASWLTKRMFSKTPFTFISMKMAASLMVVTATEIGTTVSSLVFLFGPFRNYFARIQRALLGLALRESTDLPCHAMRRGLSPRCHKAWEVAYATSMSSAVLSRRTMIMKHLFGRQGRRTRRVCRAPSCPRLPTATPSSG